MGLLSKKKNPPKKSGNAKPAVKSTQKRKETSKAPFEIPQKVLDTAAKFGVPLAPIMSWAESVEMRLQTMQEQMPEMVQTAMSNAIEQARQRAMQAAAQNPQVGGAGQLGLGDILRVVGSAGGGPDEETQRLTKQIMQLSIDRMKSDIGFSEAIKNAVVQKLAGKAAAELTNL